MAQASRTLDPAVLDQLSGLSLVARKVVEGFMAGHHTSPHRGSSVEFAQHRAYAPGDELRRIDWKVFARNERLVVKEYVEETNLSCHILLDASESMDYGSLNWTKFDYARWCAAALAHLVLTQRDTAGMLLFDEQMQKRVPPGNGAPQEASILSLLEEAEPSGPTSIAKVLNTFAPRLNRRGIVCIFSDFFDDLDGVLEGLRRLVFSGHEPILFQVLDPMETRFDFEALMRLEGLEGTGRHKIDPKAIREAYLEEINEHNRQLARQARALSVDYLHVNTAVGPETVLSTYLAQRSARSRDRRS